MARPDKHKFGEKYTSQLGLGRNFFHNLKKNNPECLAYIQAKDPDDIINAYRLYLKDKFDTTQEACKVYMQLEDKYLLAEFGSFLVKKGLYSTAKSYFYSYRNIFRSDNMVKEFATLMNIKKSNEYYKEFQASLEPALSTSA